MPLYCLENSRTSDQRAEMVRLEESGVCIFCPEHLRQSADHEILLRTEHWTVVPNRYPYVGARRHFLLVPDEHVSDLVDLSPESRADYWRALEWVRDHHGLTHYGLGVRNGDCRFTGGTIFHVHVHILVGDVESPDHTPVRMKLSSRPAEA